MKNNTNIYDVDMNLIRKAGDNHPFTIEEVEKMIEDLSKKIQDEPEKEIYRVYMNNAQKWLRHMYENMSREELEKKIAELNGSFEEAKKTESEAESAKLDAISEAMEKLKAEYEEENEVQEESIQHEDDEEVK